MVFAAWSAIGYLSICAWDFFRHSDLGFGHFSHAPPTMAQTGPLPLICLLRGGILEELCRMEMPEPNQTVPRASRPWVKEVTVKITILVLLGVLLGLGHGWAASRLYSPTRVAGFHTGVVEGALMPAAMPSLLMGKDLPIYAPNNTGRAYNIGFLLGINMCGTVFFGVAFWRPRKR
jgi:hypothetical protein